MAVQLLIAAIIFAAIALFSPRIFDVLATRAGRPHHHLVLVFRIWFGLLALASLAVLLHQPHPHR